jgi:hypothetical protein
VSKWRKPRNAYWAKIKGSQIVEVAAAGSRPVRRPVRRRWLPVRQAFSGSQNHE